MNEATAAAAAYGLTTRTPAKLAVYDLGGGTFDVSILELQDGVYQVLATAGDTYLGGRNFDELIAQRLISELANETGTDPARDPMALQGLMEAAERAKIELSSSHQTEIEVPLIAADSAGPIHLRRLLTREELEQMIAPMLEHTATLCRNALRDAGLRAQDIDVVLPVGGQTRTPAVQETMRRVFGREPERGLDPLEAVALGVATQAGILQGEVTDLVVLDVTPHSLGVETKDDGYAPVIERNSNIPTKQSRIFRTTVDGQSQVGIHVLQGEGKKAHENTSLGRFLLDGLPPSKAGELPIDVIFEIDVNGLVQVRARDLYSGRERHVTVQPSSGLTVSELEDARRAVTQRSGY